MAERIHDPFAARGTQTVAPAPAPAAAAVLPLRQLTGWEEEYVELHQDTPNTARLCNEVLARCMVAPGARTDGALAVVRGLLVAERDRELARLRRMSLGPNVVTRLVCTGCGEPNEAEFSLDALPLDFPTPPRRVELEVDAVPAVLRLPTAGDQEELLDAGVEGTAARRTWLLAHCLERYGEQRRGDGVDLDFARSLPSQVRGALAEAIDRALPDFDLRMSMVCWSCQLPSTVPFDIPGFFFRTSGPVGHHAARRPRAGDRLPLGAGRHPRSPARPAAGVSVAHRGGRARPPVPGTRRVTPLSGGQSLSGCQRRQDPHAQAA